MSCQSAQSTLFEEPTTGSHRAQARGGGDSCSRRCKVPRPILDTWDPSPCTTSFRLGRTERSRSRRGRNARNGAELSTEREPHGAGDRASRRSSLSTCLKKGAESHQKLTFPDTTHGTGIFTDQLGWCQGGQWGGSPMAVPWVVSGIVGYPTLTGPTTFARNFHMKLQS